MGTGTPVITGEEITAEKMNLKLESLNDSNLLAGLTPVMSGWIQNPGTNEDLTSEHLVNLTTLGISDSENEASIIYDMGSSKRILLYAYVAHTNYDVYYFIPRMEQSEDGISYTSIPNPVISSQFQGAMIAALKTRYLRFNTQAMGLTYSAIILRAYLL